MGEIRVGTSGYDYPDWRQVFYPPALPREEELFFYGARFDTVELNFSYYRMPSAGQLTRLMRRAPAGLDFSIKAHQSLTHLVDISRLSATAAEYREALTPLRQAGRLAAVLLQFPYSFHYTLDNRRYLDRLIKELAGLPLVAEFREAQWLNSRVFAGLRGRQVGFCCVDLPRLKGLPPAVDVVTADLAYVRFHGRNSEHWWGEDAAARFDYLYSREELEGWLGRIRAMLGQAKTTRVYFNNHRRGQAVQNAQMLKEMLGVDPLSLRSGSHLLTSPFTPSGAPGAPGVVCGKAVPPSAGERERTVT